MNSRIRPVPVPDEERVVFPDKDKYNFELSVLKGITEAYNSTVTVFPNSQGGLVHEVRIPVID